MLTLDTPLRIPDSVLYTTVPDGAVLLNSHTNKYFSLNEVGMDFWKLLTGGLNSRECLDTLLKSYEVPVGQLEPDLLELVNDLVRNGLLEIAEA